MEIKAVKLSVKIEIRPGIFVPAKGWAIEIDGNVVVDGDGEAVYFSVNRADIDREIRRLRFLVASEIRRSVEE